MIAMVTARETGPTQKLRPFQASKTGSRKMVGGKQGPAITRCADIVIASEDVIGTPYAVHVGSFHLPDGRLAFAKVKWHSLTGPPLTGVQAAEAELINEAVPFERLEAHVAEIATELARIPGCRCAASPETDRQPGLREHGPGPPSCWAAFDGLMRNTPDAPEFIRTAQTRVCGSRGRASATARLATTAKPHWNCDPTTHVITLMGACSETL